MALIDLGYCVAKLTVLDDSGYHRLQIMVPAQREHGTDIPDNSIEIYGKYELVALRDALNAAYPADATTVEAFPAHAGMNRRRSGAKRPAQRRLNSATN